MNNVRNHRVLVTGADSRKSLAIVRGLGKEFEVWTASACRPAIAAWSRYSKKHLIYKIDENFPEWLLETAKKNKIDIIICVREESFILVSKRYNDFIDAGIILTFPDFETLNKAFDKAETIRIAKKVGVPVPKTAVLTKLSEAEKLAAQIGYPVVVKPRYSVYWDGASFWLTYGPQYVNTPEELQNVISQYPSNKPLPLLQEFIPGKGIGGFFLMDKDGNVCAEFAHKRLRDVRPTGSGSTLRQSTRLDPKLRELSVSLLRGMQWWGIAMVEFRKDERNGNIYLMEVNGRFWGSLALAIEAGVNFPKLLVDVVQGQTVKPPSYQEGIVVRWWLGDLLRTIRLMKGKPKNYPGKFPSRLSALWEFIGPQPQGTINEVFNIKDPWPVLAEIISGLKRLI